MEKKANRYIKGDLPILNENLRFVSLLFEQVQEFLKLKHLR
jgi:hypothetical protein